MVNATELVADEIVRVQDEREAAAATIQMAQSKLRDCDVLLSYLRGQLLPSYRSNTLRRTTQATAQFRAAQFGNSA